LFCLQRLFSSPLVRLITTGRHVYLVVSLLTQLAVHIERHLEGYFRVVLLLLINGWLPWNVDDHPRKEMV
jgi:hypothetical protein